VAIRASGLGELTHRVSMLPSTEFPTMMLMNKEEKIRALDYLDQKGVFKITKTSLLLCDAMQISKYTLYNYLEEARISRKSETNE
jgi:predicted transcriptional regulator YheO